MFQVQYMKTHKADTPMKRSCLGTNQMCGSPRFVWVHVTCVRWQCCPCEAASPLRGRSLEPGASEPGPDDSSWVGGGAEASGQHSEELRTDFLSQGPQDPRAPLLSEAF